MSEPVLTRTERDGAVWQKLKKHLEARLDKLRSANDKVLPEARTNWQRGRIAEVKALLTLGDEAPTLNEPDDKLFD